MVSFDISMRIGYDLMLVSIVESAISISMTKNAPLVGFSEQVKDRVTFLRIASMRIVDVLD
ncbi:MAG: hypothetical protein EAX81_02860 [Candidatus Thorarchaeota archaeon]|nr:hypothetical protein [Candidatus Thorarchaeota archaeon]